MQRDPRAFLWDVQQAAGAITQFTAGLDAAGYRATPLIRSAGGAAIRDYRRGAEPAVEGSAGPR